MIGQISGRTLSLVLIVSRIPAFALSVELMTDQAVGQTQPKVSTTRQSMHVADKAEQTRSQQALEIDTRTFPGAIRLDKFSASRETDPDIWRTANRCGVNALYVLLKLYGCAPDYKDIMTALPIDASGTSLQNLKEVANTYGRSLNVYRATPDGLAQLLPAIVHREEQTGITGHFDVIVSCSEGKLAVVNGTTGALTRESLAEFDKMWTGYLLTGVEPKSSWIPRVLMAVPSFMLGFASMRAYRWYRGKPRVRLPITIP